MDSLRNYDVNFVKLKFGQHDFDYEINDDFFRIKEHSLIEQGKINVHLNIDKKERLMNLRFQMEGVIRSECDKCLDPFELPVKGSDSIILKIVDEPGESDGEIIYLGPNEISYNVYDTIYEIICTSIPMSKTCRDNALIPKECNPEMLQFLSDKNDKNLKIEYQTDPRWDKLKNIKE